MKHCVLLILAALSLAGSAFAQADASIAVVDLMKVFETHPETSKATSELTSARNALRDQFVKESNDLKSILQKHQEAIRSGDRATAEELLKQANEAEKAVATLKTTQERDLKEQFSKKKAEILKSIKASVSAFNADKKYALILDKSAFSENGLPMVLDSSGATDVTDQVIARIKAE